MLAGLLPEIREKELPGHQRSQTSCRASSRRQMEKNTARARLRAEDRRDGGDAHVDFLCDAGAIGVDGQAVASADDAGHCAGTFSHRQPLWAIRSDDARPVRNRVSRLRRPANVARLSLTLQAPKPKQAPEDFRPLPSTFPLHFV